MEAVRRRGLEVRCLVRPTSNLSYLRPLTPELVFGNVTLPGMLAPALEGVDAVIHCAGLTKAPSRFHYFEANEGGAKNLYNACLMHKEKILKIVHVSSLAAIGPSQEGAPVTEETGPHPVSDYGASKLAGQRIAEARMADFPISIVVPPGVYGPRDRDFLVYFKWVARGRVPLIGRQERYLSLIHVQDLAEAVVELLVSDRSAGRAFLVDDGGVHTWTGVAGAIGRALNRTFKPLHVPVGAVRTLGMIGDLYAKITGKAPVINSQKVRELLQSSWTCSSRRICAELGFRAQYPLERGIRETLAWYRENRWL